MTRWRRRHLLLGSLGLLGAAVAPPSRAATDVLHRLHTGDLGVLALVDARLGGASWRCLIDTGASVSVVSPSLAARERLREVARTRVATAGGVTEVAQVELPPVELAGHRLDGGRALVLDLAPVLGEVGVQVDGVLGAPLLRPRVTQLALAAGRVSIDDAPPAPAAGTVAWPVRWDAGLPVVDLALGDRPPAPFLVDTGNAGALVVFAHHAARLAVGASLPTLTLHELGGPVTVHQLLVERVSAPGWVARDVPAAFEAGGGARRGGHFDRLAGSLGLALFAPGSVTLDGPGERLVVDVPGLPAPTPLPGGFGFALRGRPGDAPAVSSVFDGGPAARAGVAPGQVLRALDGRRLDGVAATEVWRALHGVERARFDFDGLPAPVTLARERFFARWR